LKYFSGNLCTSRFK